MASSFDELSPRAALVEIGRDFHTRGWMAGTAGNLSARADEEHFWITASGLPKGRLDESDFILARIADGSVVERTQPHQKPSAETSIHAAIYRRCADARGCLHGHSVAACLATARVKTGAKALRLPALEMIKGFDVWQARPRVDLTLFENHLDVARIARDIDSRFKRGAPSISALLVREHGPTVWGRGLQEAYNRFEILDFLLNYLARR
ncbi:MAG: methylthioribulose 1-phosphate dehydratase [Gammaproteobacteria bacterium]|nr:methylthioribulose 1-phosphate dehydratase [Gammaproteobacteria bacterium]